MRKILLTSTVLALLTLTACTQPSDYRTIPVPEVTITYLDEYYLPVRSW